MYRSRFGKNLDERMLEYVSSVSDDAEIARYDILGSQAHTIMLYKSKLISINEAKKILNALEKLKNQNFAADSEAEDIHEQIESEVIKKTGMLVGGKMHTARSRNDQVALDLRMKIRDDINTICGCILELVQTLLQLAQKHTFTIMPLYTHLQQAQTGVFSHYLISYADVLLRDFERLYSSYERVNQSPLGAGPVGGTSLPINRQTTAKLLGFSQIVENTVDATGSRDVAAEFVASVCILMTNLSRIAEDLVIWSSAEFSFVELSDQFSSPSSVMPQKKNPDILELTRGKTARLIGNLVAVLSGLKGLASGYGRDLQELKIPLFSSSKIAISALLVLNSVFSTIKVNKERMENATKHSYLTALDVAEELVKQGVAFRQAHKIVGKLVQLAYQKNKTLEQLSEAEIKSVEQEFDAKKLLCILYKIDAAYSIKARTSEGSAGVMQQKKMIASRIDKVRRYGQNHQKRVMEVSSALDKLHHMVKNLR